MSRTVFVVDLYRIKYSLAMTGFPNQTKNRKFVTKINVLETSPQLGSSLSEKKTLFKNEVDLFF